MLTVELVGDRELIAKLTGLPDRLRDSVARVATRLAVEFERNVKLKLSGAVLNVRTGVLRESIRHQIQQSMDSISVKVGTDVPYARYQEEGVPHSWEIRPKSARALMFEVGGKTVFAQRVIHPPLPARSFLASTLEEMTPQIKADFEAAIRETVAR